MFLDLDTTTLLAQQGSEAAADVIQGALQLSEDTIASWNETWNDLIRADSPFWQTIVQFSRGILALCFLYMFCASATKS
jgi:DNA-binding GntR family transcriptional regulator